MKVVTINLNGLKNPAERGFGDWLKQQDADVICIQNLRCREAKIADEFYEPKGYFGFFADGDNPDEGGTAIYSREMPKAALRGFGYLDADLDGRFVQVDFEQVSVASVLFPTAAPDDDEALNKKFHFMEHFINHLKKTRRKRREFIFAGTYYMAHKTTDLGNWQNAQREPGFLPEERAWLDQVTGPVGFVDAFRVINKKENQHSYWPFDEAKANGMRIDYQMVTPNLADYVMSAKVQHDARFSPFCPVEIEYDCDL